MPKKEIVSGVMQSRTGVVNFFNQGLCYSSKFNVAFLGKLPEGQPKYICILCFMLAFHPLMPSSPAPVNLVLFHGRSPADGVKI